MLTQRQLIKDGKQAFKTSFRTMAAFHQQFRWLRKRIGLKGDQFYLDDLGIGILDYQLAAEREFYRPALLFRLEPLTHEKMYFLDKNGEIVFGHLHFTKRMKKFIFFGPVVTRRWDPKTKGIANEFESIMHILEGLDESVAHIRWCVSYFPYTDAVIIYNVPENFDFLRAVRARLARDLRVESQTVQATL
jgi:hypothetical protein